MTGKRVCGPASLTLSMTTSVPKELRSGIRELSGLVTDEAQRRKGYADALLHTVCYEADKERKVLLLTVKGDLPDHKLVKLYEKHGFQILQTQPNILMARKANG